MNVCKQMYANFAELLRDNPRQKAFYDWVLAQGIEFKGRTLTRVERKWLQTRVSRRLFTYGWCFPQSQTGAVDGILRYFEGQANTKSLGIPLEHAWLVDKDGEVWDATWKDGDDYFGVEIPPALIRKSILDTGSAVPLLGRFFSEMLEAKSAERKT